jgi:hypothetical protein
MNYTTMQGLLNYLIWIYNIAMVSYNLLVWFIILDIIMDLERIKFLKLVYIEIKIYYNNLKFYWEGYIYKNQIYYYNINIKKLKI